MKSRLKGAFKFIAFLAFIIVVCFVLMIPQVAAKVSTWTGVSAAKIRNVAVTVAGAAIGVMLLSFGVTALAAVPIVGIALIVIGLAVLTYSVWPLFSKPSGNQIQLGDKGLQNLGTR